MAQFSPSLKYDHAFTIVRVDAFQGVLDDPAEAITIQKVVWSQESAEREVARLAGLNGERRCRYFWQITRIQRR